MGLITAFKAFFKAFKDPQGAQQFLDGQQPSKQIPQQESDPSHLRLLAILQRTGRLIDFIQEDISSFDDAQVGAAVRQIHQDCQKTLDDLVAIRPLLDENEGSKIQIAAGYDPSMYKLVGHLSGTPPFTGTVIHRGWKAHKKSLPKKTDTHLDEIICPAEIDIIRKS
ncbi:DUF2760 domain-containing protein [Parachlamydia acanthamoebae]|uniref:DUF2760 domain-containing protein n=1 Tax=Parachlamydia acanthamoebae (strain UV7) TaxID=765952 RepID=F8L0D8_PARAV|nr:DUF2760 domain-containing protein [Parachlamydia acanthamoebae]CCB86668.1 putative uncharacterized protein [Parachlamydia acanthamoebae UV-7]